MSTDAMWNLVERAIVASPYGRLLDLCCERVEPDCVAVRLPYRSDVTTIGDLVHGGAIASLVDVAATAACWATPDVPPGARGTTIGFTIHFLTGARAQDLVAAARVIQRGGSISVVEVDVRGADGLAVSRATVTYKLSLPKARGGLPSE
jgi:uncharacterized protein (TIGR00369 family)